MIKNFDKNLILLVDNSKLSLLKLSTGLEKKGYDIINANEVETAFSIAKEYKPMFIFCEYNMPGLTGLDLCKMIRYDEELKDCIFVIISESATDLQVAEEFHDLPDSWIDKSIELENFIINAEKWIKMGQ